MINFTKMHGLGNDFVVMNNLDGDVCLSVEEIRYLADRRLGVGFDQLLMIESASFEVANSIIRSWSKPIPKRRLDN